jgi:hypothetical protein
MGNTFRNRRWSTFEYPVSFHSRDDRCFATLEEHQDAVSLHSRHVRSSSDRVCCGKCKSELQYDDRPKNAKKRIPADLHRIPSRCAPGTNGPVKLTVPVSFGRTNGPVSLCSRDERCFAARSAAPCKGREARGRWVARPSEPLRNRPHLTSSGDVAAADRVMEKTMEQNRATQFMQQGYV